MFLGLGQIGWATRGMEEADKMGMIAFYAGLFIGMLLGFVVVSLWAFYLAKPKDGARSDLAARYAPANLLDSKTGAPAVPRS